MKAYVGLNGPMDEFMSRLLAADDLQLVPGSYGSTVVHVIRHDRGRYRVKRPSATHFVNYLHDNEVLERLFAAAEAGGLANVETAVPLITLRAKSLLVEDEV